jgi:hypothetical protein
MIWNFKDLIKAYHQSLKDDVPRLYQTRKTTGEIRYVVFHNANERVFAEIGARNPARE